MQTGCQSKPQKFLSELAAVDLSNTSGGSLENLSQAFKRSAFLSDPGFVDDQSTAKNTCLTATETQEVVKTALNEYFMVHFTGGWVISETLLTRCYLIGFHLIGGLLGQKNVHFLKTMPFVLLVVFQSCSKRTKLTSRGARLSLPLDDKASSTLGQQRGFLLLHHSQVHFNSAR